MYTQEEAQLAQTAKANWYDRTRFEAEILPKFRAWEIDVEGNIQEAPAKPKSMADVIAWTAKWNLQKVAETIQGWTTWAIRWLGNFASFATRQASNIPNLATKLTGQGTPVSDLLNPLAQKISSWAEKLASWIESTTQTLWGLNPQSIYSKAGQFAGQVALTAPVGGIANKAAKTAWKIGLWALEGALQWGAIDVASRGKLGAWAIAWGVIGAWAPVLSKAGKALYKTAIKPNADEASQIIKATASKTKQPITRADTAFEYGILWREKDIGVQWVRESQKIFKKTIEPAFQKAEKAWIKFDYKTLIKKAKDNISKSSVYSTSQKKEILANIDELGKWLKGTTWLKNLDLEKQAIVWKIPKKYIWVLKTPRELTVAQNELSSVFRNTVHDTLKSKFGVNSSKLYRDYANLKELEKIGIKWITEWWLRWGTGTALSTIYDALATPIKTVWGKTLYKVWEWLQFTWPAGIRSIKDLAKKAGYKLIWDTLQPN